MISLPGTSYNLSTYGAMISETNHLRATAYAQAMKKVINSDSVVLEIGTGIGFFALLAIKYGARHVYAIEPNNAIIVAQENAKANNFEDRISFYQGISSGVNLPEKANVMISDMRGALPFFGFHIPSIVDARERLLKSNGVIIPKMDTVWATIVDVPKVYANYSNLWEENKYDLDLKSTRERLINCSSKISIEAENMLVEPKPWAVLDYANITDTNAQGELNWTINQHGNAHGICVWFSTELIEGIGFSNAPDKDNIPIYGQKFFPFEQLIRVEPGDFARVTLQTNLIGEDYVWRWETLIKSGSASGQIKAHFKQSDFLGNPISKDYMHKSLLDFKPRLNESGQVEEFIFSHMNGDYRLDQIAKMVAKQFPNIFPSYKAALSYVGKLSVQYSE